MYRFRLSIIVGVGVAGSAGLPSVAPPANVGPELRLAFFRTSAGVLLQWMCDATVGLSRPLNQTLIVSIFVSVSTVTNALPIPGDALGGTSCAAVSVVTNAN